MNARPSQICGELLAALDASEGRRRRRKRDTTPDAIGMTMKRELLERAVAADPDPDRFEQWLYEQCLAAAPSEGGVRATPAVVKDLQVPENPYRIIYNPPVNLAKPPDTTAHGRKPGR